MSPDEEAMRSAPPATLDVSVCRALDSTAEIRAEDDADASPGRMVGTFSTFDDFYEIDSWMEGHFLERVAPGAFKRTIKNRSADSPVRVLLEHGFDPTVGDKPLGVPEVLEERADGAYAEVQLFDTSYNRDLAPALRAGAYGQSFRFRVMRDEWEQEPERSDHNPDGIPERTITEVRLIEFGPTIFPANPGTDAGLRSTTDQFYERLRRRDPEAADAAVARSRSLRLPAAPVTTEDSPTEHPTDPPDSGHSEGSPARHSKADNPPAHTERPSSMDTTMTIEEREARRSDIVARQQEIDNQYAGAELPEEARSEFDALEEEYQTHARAIEDTRRRQEAIRAKAENPAATERVRPAETPAFHPSRDNIYDLGALRQQARSVDDLPGLYRENARRAVDGARFPGAKDRSAAQEQVEHLLTSIDDEQGTLARRVLSTGSPVYDRAFGKMLAQNGMGGLTGEEQRALSLGTNSEGGFAVPFQLDPTVILTSDGVNDPLRQISRVEQIVGKEWQGVTSAGVSVGRSAEAAESDDDSFTLAQPTVEATRVDAFVPFSLELEADWARMRAEITSVLADAKRTEEATAFMTGNGTAPNPEGLLTGTTNDVQPATASTFAVEDVYATEEALAERWLDNATWLAHRSFYNAVRQLDTSGGSNLWVRLADGLPPELIGYPALRHSEIPAFDEAAADGTVQAVFGDFSQFLIVDRIGMSVELVPHVIGANRRPTGQRGIFAYWRNACKVLVDNAFQRYVTFDGVV